MTELIKNQEKDIKSDLSRLLKESYYSLPVDKYLMVREELCQTLYWAPATFYARLRGSKPIRPIEISIIKEVFAKHGIEVFKMTA